MEKVLNELVSKLKAAHADRLVSVVLYGSAAVGDHDGRFSDLNILTVLRQVGRGDLAACEPVFRWFREKGNPAPLLLSEEEVRGCSDCFAIEFHDMKEARKVLHGADLIAGLAIDDAFYRAQVERELRVKLLRLRQKASWLLGDKPLLADLMAQSVTTFCMLLRHALALHGAPAPMVKREAATQAGTAFHIDPAPFHTLLDLRENRIRAKDLDAHALFDRYLAQIDAVIAAVDTLAK